MATIRARVVATYRFTRECSVRGYAQSRLQSQPDQIRMNFLDAVDLAEDLDREVRLDVLLHAAGEPDDAQVGVHAEPAALEGRLELEPSLAGKNDCGIIGRIVANDDQVGDAAVSQSRADSAGLLSFRLVVRLALK